MQSYLFIGGPHDGLSFPVVDDIDSIKLPFAATDGKIYIRETLAIGDVSITIYRHKSLTPEQVLSRLVEFYKAWSVNQPGVRR